MKGAVFSYHLIYIRSSRPITSLSVCVSFEDKKKILSEIGMLDFLSIIVTLVHGKSTKVVSLCFHVNSSTLL